MPLSRTPGIFQSSNFLKRSIFTAKTGSDPINRDHPSNFEIQSDQVWKSLLYFVNVLFQTKY